MKKALNSREDDHQKDLLVSLRVSLLVQGVPWIEEVYLNKNLITF